MTDLFASSARFYDLDYAGFDADLAMIQQFAARCGSPILELGCGTGRLLVPLAEQGYRLTGVDASGAMLDLARQKLIARDLAERVTLVEQDLRHLDLDDQFQFAFAAVNTFLHLTTRADQEEVLARIRRHLVPGGLVLLDLFNPDPGRLLDARGQVVLEKVMDDPETGNRLMKFYADRTDLEEQMVQVTVFVDELDGEGHVQRTLFPFSLRYLYRSELGLLLQQAGFEVEAFYGSYELDEFRGDSDKLIAVARRLD
jgi:ubiquinone/menaquinone biosynthesis C-methylase UbiE